MAETGFPYYRVDYLSEQGDGGQMLFTKPQDGLQLDEEDITTAIANALLSNGAATVTINRVEEASTDVTPTP